MTWTWEEIAADWLGGSAIAEDAEVAAAAFNEIEATLGPYWIERYRAAHGGVNRRGPTLTLPVVILGKQLAQIKGAPGCEGLVRRLRDRRSGADAELAAISLLMAGSSHVRLECEPKVVVSGRERKADFRLAKADDQWIYVEVTQPNRSAAEEGLALAMHEVADVVSAVEGSYATEVFFHALPTPDGLRAIRPLLEEICQRGEDAERHLPNELGVVYVGQSPPGLVVLEDHGQPYTPRLGLSKVFAGATSTRHVTVRVPFFDQRAHQFLATEAAQLPDDSPGMIMIQMSAATGGMKKWAPTLEKELSLEDMYENVSAICLFASVLVGTDRGESERVETVLVKNPDAAHQLPEWADARVRLHEQSRTV